MKKIWYELEPLVYVLALLLLVGSAPTTESDSKISGNLTNVDVDGDAGGLVIVTFTFEDGTVHMCRMDPNNAYVFKLNRLNEIYYNSMGTITKVEIME